MNSLLLEPTDVLFFRDAIPMAAGQGRGAGARLPFPSTLHEAFRSTLLLSRGIEGLEKTTRWFQRHKHDGRERLIATKDFQSLRTAGPFPWHPEHGLLLPVPLDAVLADGGRKVACAQLWRDATPRLDDAFHPLCLPVAITPPDKNAQLRGWWTIPQYRAYLDGADLKEDGAFQHMEVGELWQEENRIGVEIAPGSGAAKEGQLYAGSFLRLGAGMRIAFQAGLSDPRRTAEHEALAALDWLLLGGERRLARIHRRDDAFAGLPPAPKFSGDGPRLLKWTLVTPAIFARGALPGWCSHPPGKPGGLAPGVVRLAAPAARNRNGRRVSMPLPGRAQLVSWFLGKPLTVSGWDTIDHCAKPTQLAVPAGSACYFLCQDAATATALAARLHWRPRSDHYGEKGCGYGLCSSAVAPHPMSADVRALANEILSSKTPA